MDCGCSACGEVCQAWSVAVAGCVQVPVGQRFCRCRSVRWLTGGRGPRLILERRVWALLGVCGRLLGSVLGAATWVGAVAPWASAPGAVCPAEAFGLGHLARLGSLIAGYARRRPLDPVGPPPRDHPGPLAPAQGHGAARLWPRWVLVPSGRTRLYALNRELAVGSRELGCRNREFACGTANMRAGAGISGAGTAISGAGTAISGAGGGACVPEVGWRAGLRGWVRGLGGRLLARRSGRGVRECVPGLGGWTTPSGAPGVARSGARTGRPPPPSGRPVPRRRGCLAPLGVRGRS